jgi:hypothetical protein
MELELYQILVVALILEEDQTVLGDEQEKTRKRTTTLNWRTHLPNFFVVKAILAVVIGTVHSFVPARRVLLEN